MLKNLLKNSRLKSEIKKFYRKNKNEILDIIVFGSATRGKRHPKDLDVLLVFKDKENIDLSYGLRKKIEMLGLNVEVTNRTYKNLFDVAFLPRESILSEGFSFILDKKIHKAFGYDSFILFIYSLRGFTASKRMMFHYALHGRNKRKGILKELNGIKMTNTAILIPVEFSDEFESFLTHWDVKYKSVRILIPKRTIEYKEFKL